MEKLIKPYLDKTTNRVTWAAGVMLNSWIELPVIEEKKLPENISTDDKKFWEDNSVIFHQKKYGPLQANMKGVPGKIPGINIYPTD